MRTTLDFLCVGTAKSGTTTLHKLAAEHPRLSLPSAKEVPFFNDPAVYAKGMPWYLNQHFRKAPESDLWGTVTPQYTYFRGGLSPQQTAERIHAEQPDVKIIALVRNPIGRTFSHFKTSVRRSAERRTFEDAISELLESPELDTMRDEEWTPFNRFLFASEYRRVLEPYVKLFGREHVLVMYAEDLYSQPLETMATFYDFIGVENQQPESKPETHHNQGGMEPRVGLLTPRYLHKSGIRRAWRALVPYKLRKSIEVRVNSWNAKPDTTRLDPASPARTLLTNHFRADVDYVSELVGKPSPWGEWQPS